MTTGNNTEMNNGTVLTDNVRTTIQHTDNLLTQNIENEPETENLQNDQDSIYGNKDCEKKPSYIELQEMKKSNNQLEELFGSDSDSD